MDTGLQDIKNLSTDNQAFISILIVSFLRQFQLISPH